MSAGYSKTPLVKKLGIKSGMAVLLKQTPANYLDLLGELPENVAPKTTIEEPLDFAHFFTKERNQLEAEFPILKQSLKPNGVLWISWPKKASKIETDLTEDVIRRVGLANGLVDVKVCAVDDVWSGLKFVYRLADR